MTTSSSKVHVVNLSSYTTPNISEVQGKDWVQYGDDNNYFQYLIDRYNGSPTNNALINGVVDFVYGKGLDATNSAKKPSEYAAMKGLFSKDCVKKLVADYKMMGQCAIQVIYSQDHNTIVEIEHIPIETLRAEKCNEDGEIEGYYYAKSWSDVASRKETPVRIPAFGTSREGLEILYIKPYRAGFYYYSPVDYQGGLPYAELEEEIANFHINNIQNGLNPSMLINFNNGVPSEEERRAIEMQIANKFSGTSNAGKFILAFNDNAESKATLETVQLSDAHNQYQFLSNEAMQKLMVAHRITSPMLLGIKDSTGLGNNADELKTASILFENIVIKPIQETLLDGFEKILTYNDIRLNLYFKTLQPLEFTADIETPMDAETREEETGVKLSSVDFKEPCWEGYEMIGFKIKDGQRVPNCVPIEAADQMRDEIFMQLNELGEVIDESEWELVDERPVDYEAEVALSKYAFASTGSAFPNAKSSQDGVTEEGRQYKVRYAYAPNATKANSREFCKKMVAANKVYRKEDIERMGSQAVNAGFGVAGADTYSIWLYKGGARCHHFWMRKTYLAKAEGVTPDVGNPNAEVTVNQARRAGVDLEQNPKDVALRPVDMPNEGFVNPRK
jgi:hypothetical protein